MHFVPIMGSHDRDSGDIEMGRVEPDALSTRDLKPKGTPSLPTLRWAVGVEDEEILLAVDRRPWNCRGWIMGWLVWLPVSSMSRSATQREHRASIELFIRRAEQ